MVSGGILKKTEYSLTRIVVFKIMLDKKVKQRIINRFKTHAHDTGSTQVQIAILTEEMKRLSEHLATHKHDHSSRRGLLRKVNERRKLIKYLQKEDEKSFRELTAKLKLKVGKKIIEEEEERQRKEQEELAKMTEVEVEDEESEEGEEGGGDENDEEGKK